MLHGLCVIFDDLETGIPEPRNALCIHQIKNYRLWPTSRLKQLVHSLGQFSVFTAEVNIAEPEILRSGRHLDGLKREPRLGSKTGNLSVSVAPFSFRLSVLVGLKFHSAARILLSVCNVAYIWFLWVRNPLSSVRLVDIGIYVCNWFIK